IINNKEKHPDAHLIEVVNADLDHALEINGYELDDDTEIQHFKVDDKAFVVEDERETQIAPYDRQFASKSVGQRGMQPFAGPMMSFGLAILLFLVIGLIQGVPSEEALLGEVQDGRPAEEAGVQQGDEVTQVDGSPVTAWEEFTSEIEQHSEEQIDLMVKRGDETI